MYKEWLFEFSRLIRLKNLAILVVTQAFVRLFLINPVFFNYKIEHALAGWQFALFVLATVCIAAAGYIINDYFDADIDRINKPGKVVVGRYFSRREAFRMHLAFNVLGALLGVLAAWLAGNITLGFIFIVSAGLLWFYAKTFKKVFLLGNLLVAAFTAFAILTVVFFETGLFGNADLLVLAANREVFELTLAYAAFAMITTTMRELVKDMEDIEGDRAYGCKTVPVVLGVTATKWFIAALCVALIGLLFFAQSRFFREELFLRCSYILIALQLPAAALLFYLVPAAQKEDFARLSKGVKNIMLLGIVSMAVFYYF